MKNTIHNKLKKIQFFLKKHLIFKDFFDIIHQCELL